MSSKHSKRIVTALCMVFGLSLMSNYSQAYPIVEFSGGSATFGGGDFTIGFTFSVTGGSLLVDGLSWWDEGSDGLINSHEVGLWTSSGSLLASTTVTNGSIVEASTSGFGRWLVQDIPNLTLNPGNYIVAGVQANSLGGDLIRILATGTAQSGVVYGDTIQTPPPSTTTLTFPTVLVPPANAGAWGPNVHIVPTPATLALFGLGLLGLGWSRRKTA